MSRKSIICLFAVLLLAGCGRSPLGTGYAVTYPEQLRDSNVQTFSYTHFLRLVMAHDSVKPRFERARDLCLRDTALGCKLIAAAISVNDSAYVTGDQASLAVALPHDKVAVFEKALLESLPQDGSDKVSVRSRTTSAENVTTEASDTDRKITQLTAYRDKLAALAKRSDLSVADLMKVEAELSKVEGDLDAALSDKRNVGERVAKERLTVSLGEKQALDAPIARVWHNAVDTFVESTANAIDFLIRIIPWLPIIAGGVFLISLFWRWFRRKKVAA
jgi:uncharacterized protein (DUF2384 family)